MNLATSFVLLIGAWTSSGLGYDGAGPILRADYIQEIKPTLGLVMQGRALIGSKVCCGDVTSYALLTGATFGARGWYGEVGTNVWRADFADGTAKSGEGIFIGIANRSQHAAAGIRWFAPTGVDRQEILRAYVDVRPWRDLSLSVESEWHSFQQEGKEAASGQRTALLVGWTF